jgi:hypothetical protein
MSFTGNLKTVAFPDILQLLSAGSKTGTLAITRGHAKREIFFNGGNIVSASTESAEEEFLGSLLVRQGRIGKADLGKALDLHKSSGKKLGLVLSEMELLSREEIANCLKQQIEEIIYNLFSWTEGDFVFQKGKLPKATGIQVELQTINVIMEGTRRIDEWLEIQKRLPKDDVVLQIVLGPKSKSGDITLTLEEFQVLSLINGERTIPEIVGISPAGEFGTYRGIYKLLSAELIGEAKSERADFRKDPREEEQVWWLILKLYSACFYAIKRMLERKVGPENSRVKDMLATYRTGVWAYFTGLGSSDFRTNFANFHRTIQRIPEEARLHRLLTGLNHILAEQLSFVGSLLGTDVLRTVESEIKKAISIPLTEKRALSSKYDLENDIDRALKSKNKPSVI